MSKTHSEAGRSIFREFLSKWNWLSRHDGFLRHPALSVLRLFCWRCTTWLRVPWTIRIRKWDVKMFLPASWRGTAKIMYIFREYYDRELQYLAQNLAHGDSLIDVGANYGIYSIVAARLVGPSGRVIAFEPAKSASEVLARNVRINNLDNTCVVQAAASDHKGQARLYLHPDSSRNALGANTESREFELIDTLTVDDVLMAQGISQVTALKIDVEGAEELVLRGSAGLFSRSSPTVIFEVNPKGAQEMGLSPSGAWCFLAERGYQFYSVDEAGALVPLSVQPSGGNVIATKEA